MSSTHPDSSFEPNVPLSTNMLGAGEFVLNRHADRAIDAALRSVPLPDGLLTRLGRLACSVPDEAADQMDWLGC